MSRQQGRAARVVSHLNAGQNLTVLRSLLTCLLAIGLIATACSVDATSLDPQLTVEAPDDQLPTAAADPATTDLPTGVSPSTTGATATTVAAWTDPGSGSPSQRCGIEPPLTIGRIGLDLDLIVAAPAAYLDLAAVTEPYPDTAETLELGLLCLVVHDLAAGSISCGFEQQGTSITPVRHEPLVVTMIWFLADAHDEPVAQPTQKIYEDCDTDRLHDPLELEGDVGEPRLVRPMIDAEFLRSPFDTGARFYAAQDPGKSPYTNRQCINISVATERLDDIGKIVADVWKLPGFWQPIPEGHVPSDEGFAAIEDAIDSLTDVNGLVINGHDDATATLAQLAGLSNWMVGRVGTLAVDHEQKNDPRFADHVAWQMGGIASSGLDPHETASMLRAIAANRCSGEQLAAAVSTDSSCESLELAYAARTRFRAALDVEPDLRRELTWYLNVFDPHGFGDPHEMYSDPRLDADGLSGMYYAERALASLIDEGRPLRVEEVERYETSAQTIHAFARENCPHIANIDLPSVFDSVPPPDADDVAAAVTTFCTHLDGFLQLRADFRAGIDGDPASTQPISPGVIAQLRSMRDHTKALVDLFEDQAVSVNPNGLHVGSFTFESLNETEQMVRLANYGPSAVPIAVYSDDDGAEPENVVAQLAAEKCPDIDATTLATPLRRSNLPGPKVPAQSIYGNADDLCPTTAHVLTARSGFRSRLADHLAGDPDAAFDAELYVWQADEIGFFLSDALRAAMPDATISYEMERALTTPDNQIAGAAFDDWFDNDYFETLLAARSELLVLLRGACPDLAADLADTADADRSLVAAATEINASANGDTLPTDMTLADTCSYLEGVFRSRAAFRTAIANDDLETADAARGNLFSYALWDVETFPEGFDSNRLSSLSDLEDALYYRAAYDSPIDARRAAGDEGILAIIVAWTQTNCPAVTIGLDEPSVLDVFPAPDADKVAETQAAYCSAAAELLGARSDFRRELEGGSDAAALAAYQRIVDSHSRLMLLTGDQLHLFPNGTDFYGSGNGQDVFIEETLIRQAAIGTNPIPIPKPSSRSAGDSVTDAINAICEQPADPSLHPVPAQIEAVEALSLPTLQHGDELTEPTAFCQDLLVAQTALHHLMASLDDAVLGDEIAWADALGYAQRHSNVGLYRAPEGMFSDEQLDAIPEGTASIPVHRDLVLMMQRALLGEPTFDDRYDVADEVAAPMVLAPLVTERCDIPDHLANVDISDALTLFDLIVAQTTA